MSRRVKLAVWVQTHFVSPPSDATSYIVNWDLEVRQVMQHMPRKATTVPPVWSDELCKAIIKGIEMGTHFLTICTQGIKIIRKALSNTGGNLVDYANEKLLRRGGHNIKGQALDNYTYAQSLRNPHNRDLLRRFDSGQVLEYYSWDDDAVYNRIEDEGIGDMLELTAMYLWTMNDYRTMAEFTYYYSTAAFLYRALPHGFTYYGTMTSLDPEDTDEPLNTA